MTDLEIQQARLELLDYMDAVILHNRGSLPTVKEMLDARKTIEFGGHSLLLSDLHARIVAGAGTPAEAAKGYAKTD